MKQPGRVGQASVFGCGCWAQRAQKPKPGSSSQSKSSFSVGISTTGCGEHLVRTFLARECAQHLSTSKVPYDALQTVMKEKFAESVFLGKYFIVKLMKLVTDWVTEGRNLGFGFRRNGFLR